MIRELAGHIDPAMTRWYAHPRMMARRAAVEKLSTMSRPEIEGGYDTNNVTAGKARNHEAESNARKQWRALEDDFRTLITMTDSLGCSVVSEIGIFAN